MLKQKSTTFGGVSRIHEFPLKNVWAAGFDQSPPPPPFSLPKERLQDDFTFEMARSPMILCGRVRDQRRVVLLVSTKLTWDTNVRAEIFQNPASLTTVSLNLL